MRARANIQTNCFAGILMVVLFAAGVLAPLSSIETASTRWTLGSYHSAVRVFERARSWSRIARWWIDPEVATNDYQRVYEQARLGA